MKKVKKTEEQEARRKRVEAGQIKKYNALVDDFRKRRQEGVNDNESFDITTKILEMNPEGYTVWNYRREVLAVLLQKFDDEEKQKWLEGELRFLEGCLKKFPKVYWIWNHRRWCLKNSPRPDWKRELELVSKMLEYDPRNFHGWHYRREVIANIEKQTGRSMVKEEVQYTTKKINSNFSNFSAWHNRVNLIPQLIKEDKLDGQKVLKEELDYTRNALYTDPDDQSSWLYHRWLIMNNAIAPDLTVEERLEILNAEIKSIQELEELEPDNKWCLLSLVEYEEYKSKLQGQKSNRPETLKRLEKLKKADPMRLNRYKYLEQQLVN